VRWPDESPDQTWDPMEEPGDEGLFLRFGDRSPRHKTHRGAGDFFRENLQTAGFFVAFPGTSPRPGRDIPERRQPEAIPDQGGFVSRLTGTGVVGTRGGSGVLSGE